MARTKFLFVLVLLPVALLGIGAGYSVLTSLINGEYNTITALDLSITLVSILYFWIVTLASAELSNGKELIRDDVDRILHRGRHHPENWWLDRYPGHCILSTKKPRRRSPLLREHYAQWKASMIESGYGPGLRDPLDDKNSGMNA